MCLIAWNWQPHSPMPLLLLSNRDELYARPALPLHRWQGGDVLAGQDLQAGGTWLGLHRSGRLAALTNYRDLTNMRSNAPSRGELVTGFLDSTQSAADWLAALAPNAHRYNPFNLLLYDGTTLMGFESRHTKAFAIAPGVGAVSNADFETPWPKLLRWKQALQTLPLTTLQTTEDATFLPWLQDRQQAPDADLPATGLPPERERALSAPFIVGPDYGTRACSIVRMWQTSASFSEYSFDTTGFLGQAQFDLTLSGFGVHGKSLTIPKR